MADVSDVAARSPGSVAIVVVAADRGHFNWSLPLAEALVTPKVLRDPPVVQKVEYWTSEESQLWLNDAKLPPDVTLGGSTGSFSETKKLVEVFTELSSSGDTDEDGGRALEEHFAQEVQRRGVAPTLDEALSKITPPQEVQDALLSRLKMADVAIVVYEQVGVRGQKLWRRKLLFHRFLSSHPTLTSSGRALDALPGPSRRATTLDPKAWSTPLPAACVAMRPYRRDDMPWEPCCPWR